MAVLARDLGINRSTVTSRIDRLVDSGVIEGFTIRASNDVDRDAVRGVTTLVAEPNQGRDVVRKIRGYPEVERLHSTTGAWDLVVQLRCRSLSEFDLVLERIRDIPGVRDTQTSLLSTPSQLRSRAHGRGPMFDQLPRSRPPAPYDGTWTRRSGPPPAERRSGDRPAVVPPSLVCEPVRASRETRFPSPCGDGRGGVAGSESGA